MNNTSQMRQWDTWILVGDVEKCEHTRKQIEICKEMRIPLKGAILCNDPKHADTDACYKVPSFPTFCDTSSKLCVPGLRETRRELEELLIMTPPP